MCLIAAFDIAWLLFWTGVILKVAIGLGLVIFVHELGHFLVAKACGVKCEKFFVGFDIGGYKLSHKWGETEYGIGILPLGGYVKMLGQDDDPAHIAEQMQKSQVDAARSDAVEIIGPKGERYTVDRRSYLAKSVPQRMAIISAGVVMNVIFAVIFAVIAYGMGVPYMPCIVSETVPGSPAWHASIEPGDEIVQIGDRVNPTFMQLRGGVTLGDLENGIPCLVRRAASGEEVELTLTPTRGRGLATIGIISPRSMTLLDAMPTADGSPAARARPVDPPPADREAKPVGFQGGDEIVRVNDVDVSDYRGLAAELARQPDKTLQVTVRRPAEKQPGAIPDAEPPPGDARADELTFEVPAQPLRRFGLVMKMGPIAGVQTDSPAAAAGLKTGDVIVAVDGQSLAEPRTLADWDPVTFPERMRQAAAANRSVTLTVSRRTVVKPDGAKDREQLEVSVAPRVPTTFHSALPPRAPMGVPALGIAYRIDNRIVAVLADSPAAAADVESGDLVTAVTFVLPKDAAVTESGRSVPISRQDSNWPMLFDTLQLLPAGTALELTIRSGEEEQDVKLTPQAVDDLYVAVRGFNLAPIERIRKAESFAEQVRFGWDETIEALTMVYRFLQKIGSQVPITALGGPITIAGAAASSATKGLSTLLIFLTLLSANLAVINFLPIPLLDGGHMVFLAYEGVRGRPASEKFVVALHTAGFMIIVSLMLFVLALDFNLIERNL